MSEFCSYKGLCRNLLLTLNPKCRCFTTCHCCCHVALCWSCYRSNLLGTKLPFPLKSPLPASYCRKYIISGDKHRKQDVLSCCEAIFLTLSFHHKTRRRQPLLLNISYSTLPEKSQLSIPPLPVSENNQFNVFLRQIHAVGRALTKKQKKCTRCRFVFRTLHESFH